MSKLKLLILDANVVIFSHDLGIWEKFVAACEIYLPATVIREAQFVDGEEEKKYISLDDDISSGRIQVFDVPLSQVNQFLSRFDLRYVSELDPGELEALAYLNESEKDFSISSGDAIVYRVLAVLGKVDQGISFEEILTKVGLKQPGIKWQFTKGFREKYTKEGQVDLVQGRGLRK